MKSFGNGFNIALVALLSFVSIVISIIALCSNASHNFHKDDIMWSSMNIIVTLLIGIITILITWQIWNVLRIKEQNEELIKKYAMRGRDSALFISLAQIGSSHVGEDDANASKLLLNALAIWEKELNTELDIEAYNFCVKTLKEYYTNQYVLIVPNEDEKIAFMKAAVRVGDNDIINFVSRIKVDVSMTSTAAGCPRTS